jgi:hypothetical protein
MNPLKCAKLAVEVKQLTKRNKYLDEQNTIQAAKLLELEAMFERERESHLLTLYTAEGMAEHSATIGEFRRNWEAHLNGGLESIKHAPREKQNAYLAKWGVELATKE